MDEVNLKEEKRKKRNQNQFGFETLSIHAGQSPDPSTGAIMTPIFMSSTFAQSSPGKHKGYEYSRTSNPTRKAYEDCIAALEGGNKAFAVSSGCAAITIVLHLLEPGDHVLAVDDMYGGTYRLFESIFRKNGIQFSYVDMTKIENFEKALKKNTKLIWIETPSNPLLKLVDIQAVSDEAKKRGILVAVDNTFMSPYFQKPFLWGADIVVHSTTKFINGHSDIIGGVVVVKSEDLSERLLFLSQAIGPTASSFDSYILLRSLKTLALRMKAHEENAKAVAEMLSKEKRVEKVIYPNQSYHSQFELVKKQMTGSGGMITFYIKGGLKASRRFLESLKIFSLAESLGGVESLAVHPALMTHASLPKERRKDLGIHDSMIRLSVGIETKDDLLFDLERALDF